MNNTAELKFRIGLVGPSRVGKTSLVATILRDAQRVLAQTTARIEPHGTASERRLQQHDNELRGALWAGEFNPGAVAGTEGVFTFELRLDPGEGADALVFGLQDFPGGWIDAAARGMHRNAEWESYKEWLARCSVLIAPIEATVLMEATAASQKRAVPSMLAIQQVQAVVEDWAKNRRTASHEPALLLLCPVKCESYFSDNGGNGYGAGKLHDDVCTLFNSVITSARATAPHVKVAYAPVDTMGCVDLIRTQWRADQNAPGGFDFTATYRVRSPGELRPKGGASVMALLCRDVLTSIHEGEKLLEKQLSGKFSEASAFATREEGFFKDLWIKLNGERDRRKLAATEVHNCLQQQQKQVAVLARALKPLAEFQLDARVIELE